MSDFKFNEAERGHIHGSIPREGELYDWQVDNVIDRIEQIINEREGWISVEDAMPPPSNRIIVCKTNGLVCEMYCNHNGNILYNGLKQTYQITHWQPLPSPPKAKKQ